MPPIFFTLRVAAVAIFGILTVVFDLRESFVVLDLGSFQGFAEFFQQGRLSRLGFRLSVARVGEVEPRADIGYALQTTPPRFADLPAGRQVRLELGFGDGDVGRSREVDVVGQLVLRFEAGASTARNG